MCTSETHWAELKFRSSSGSTFRASRSEEAAAGRHRAAGVLQVYSCAATFNTCWCEALLNYRLNLNYRLMWIHLWAEHKHNQLQHVKQTDTKWSCSLKWGWSTHSRDVRIWSAQIPSVPTVLSGLHTSVTRPQEVSRAKTCPVRKRRQLCSLSSERLAAPARPHWLTAESAESAHCCHTSLPRQAFKLQLQEAVCFQNKRAKCY